MGSNETADEDGGANADVSLLSKSKGVACKVRTPWLIAGSERKLEYLEIYIKNSALRFALDTFANYYNKFFVNLYAWCSSCSRKTDTQNQVLGGWKPFSYILQAGKPQEPGGYIGWEACGAKRPIVRSWLNRRFVFALDSLRSSPQLVDQAR